MNYLNDCLKCVVNTNQQVLPTPFFHSIVLKAATCSITNAIAEHVGLKINDPVNPHKSPGWEQYHTAHHNVNNFFHFAFVRNPFDRLVSYWKMRNYHPDFSDWIVDTNHNKDIHLTSQLRNLKPLPSFIGKFERLEKDWKVVQNVIGLPDLKHLNSTTHDHYSTYYTCEAKDFVAKKYKKELELFNYEF